MSFVNYCFQNFSEPPPNLDYTGILSSDSRFEKVIEENVILKKGVRKQVKRIIWRLKGHKERERISSYLNSGE